MTPKDIIEKIINTTSVHAPAWVTAERILAELAQAGFAVTKTTHEDTLTNIKEVYEARSELFTNDTDLAESLYDRACAALTTRAADIERLRKDAVYRCPVCGIEDESAYLRCQRPNCTDGRDSGARERVRRARIRLDDLANPNRAKCVV